LGEICFDKNDYSQELLVWDYSSVLEPSVDNPYKSGVPPIHNIGSARYKIIKRGISALNGCYTVFSRVVQ